MKINAFRPSTSEFALWLDSQCLIRRTMQDLSRNCQAKIQAHLDQECGRYQRDISGHSDSDVTPIQQSINPRLYTSPPSRDTRLIRKPPLPPRLLIGFLWVRLPREPGHGGALFRRKCLCFERPEGLPRLSAYRLSSLATASFVSAFLQHLTMDTDGVLHRSRSH